jgi:hypothetical protein
MEIRTDLIEKINPKAAIKSLFIAGFVLSGCGIDNPSSDISSTASESSSAAIATTEPSHIDMTRCYAEDVTFELRLDSTQSLQDNIQGYISENLDARGPNTFESNSPEIITCAKQIIDYITKDPTNSEYSAGGDSINVPSDISIVMP